MKNLQGDVIRIIDLADIEVASYVYDAWGNIKDTKGEPTIREINPIRYRGYVYNTETGLYYIQSRYYDPFAGRFLNADVYDDTQSGTPLSTNMFAYCENNVVMNMDNKGYSIGISSGWVSFGIDLIIRCVCSTCCLSIPCNKNSSKNVPQKIWSKKVAKYIIKKIISKCKKNLIKFTRLLNALLIKVIRTSTKLIRDDIINKGIGKILGVLNSKRVSQLYDAVCMFLSTGAFIAGVLDIVTDKHFDGVIRI